MKKCFLLGMENPDAFPECVINFMKRGWGGNTEYRVKTEYDGVLLRTYLKNCLCLSRSLVSALKREQGIFVNGEKV